MNNDREIGGRRWWERRKISKKEKTLQQQKGLPTLSADLKNNNNKCPTLFTMLEAPFYLLLSKTGGIN